MLTLGHTRRRSNPGAQSGFSLMELAVVLMIVGTMMSGVLLAVSASTLNSRIVAMRAQLREVEDALYGFAQSQARLPCPASAISNGYEARTSGVCDVMHGFVPSATLGLYGRVNSEGLLLDAWANPLRYSLVISENAGDNPDFSNVSSIDSFFGTGNPIVTTAMFEICEYDAGSDACTRVYSDTAPAVVMSLGPNGNTFTSEEETLNAGTSVLGGYTVHADTELLFVSEEYAQDLFDDQLVWLSPYILFNRLVSAGKLP